MGPDPARADFDHFETSRRRASGDGERHGFDGRSHRGFFGWKSRLADAETACEDGIDGRSAVTARAAALSRLRDEFGDRAGIDQRQAQTHLLERQIGIGGCL